MKSQSESDVKRDWLSVRQHSVCVATTCRRRAPSSACQSNPRQVERIVCGLYAANWGRCGTMVRQSEIKLKHAQTVRAKSLFLSCTRLIIHFLCVCSSKFDTFCIWILYKVFIYSFVHNSQLFTVWISSSLCLWFISVPPPPDNVCVCWFFNCFCSLECILLIFRQIWY